MADPFTVGMLTLTLGELTAIWELTDWEIPEIVDAFTDNTGANNPAFLLALQLIAGRREDPAYTLIDAGAVIYVDLSTGDADA